MRAVQLKPVQSHCQRCGGLFCYFQKCSLRLYCSPCVELERLDLLQFTKVQRRAQAVVKAQRRTISLIRRLTVRAA